jgi:hypothetical protein
MVDMRDVLPDMEGLVGTLGKVPLSRQRVGDAVRTRFKVVHLPDLPDDQMEVPLCF